MPVPVSSPVKARREEPKAQNKQRDDRKDSTNQLPSDAQPSKITFHIDSGSQVLTATCYPPLEYAGALPTHYFVCRRTLRSTADDAVKHYGKPYFALIEGVLPGIDTLATKKMTAREVQRSPDLPPCHVLWCDALRDFFPLTRHAGDPCLPKNAKEEHELFKDLRWRSWWNEPISRTKSDSSTSAGGGEARPKAKLKAVAETPPLPASSTKPKVICDELKTPSCSSQPLPADERRIAPPRKEKATETGVCTGCSKCTGKASAVRRNSGDEIGMDPHDWTPRARDAKKSPQTETVSKLLQRSADLADLRPYSEACEPYVSVFSDGGVQFREDLSDRCFDWLHVFGAKVVGQPRAVDSLQHFETAVDVGDIYKGFDLFPYGSRRRSGRAGKDQAEINHVFGPQRCYFECLRVFTTSSSTYEGDFMDSLARVCPTTGIFVTLIKAMAAVKVELLWRIRKMASVKVPKTLLENRSSRNGLQAAAATLAWLARTYSMASVVGPTKAYLHPIYEIVLADLINDCQHLECILQMIPERFSCFCCEICDARLPPSAGTTDDPTCTCPDTELHKSQRTASRMLRNIGMVLAALIPSLEHSPSDAMAERREAFFLLAMRVAKHQLHQLSEEIETKRRGGAAAATPDGAGGYDDNSGSSGGGGSGGDRHTAHSQADIHAWHRLQLKRRGSAQATETGELVDDIYAVVDETGEAGGIFVGDLLGRLFFDLSPAEDIAALLAAHPDPAVVPAAAAAAATPTTAPASPASTVEARR